MSVWNQLSTTWPFATRRMPNSDQVTFLPVGGMPKNSPRCVPLS